MKEIDKILKARDGDMVALDELYNEYKKVVVSIARKYYIIGGENEDLVQEGMIGFFKAINTFDPQKCEFVGYAKKLITHEIINAIKKDNRAKTLLLNESMVLNNQGEVILDVLTDKVLGVPSDKPSPEGVLLSEESEQFLKNKIKFTLSDFENLVLDLYLKGYSYAEIIKNTETNYKSVDNALNRIKNKLKFLKEGN